MSSLLNMKKKINSQPYQLPLPEYQDWFYLIVNNRVDQMTEILNTADDNEKHKLVNGHFDCDVNVKGSSQEAEDSVTIPLHLAVSCCSKDAAQLLLNTGADPLQVGIYNYNVLHSCVVMSFEKPDVEEKVCDMIGWLFEHLDPQVMHKLLTAENSDGFRPIEFAAQQCCLQILLTLLESKGIVSAEKHCGMAVYRYHDITEYEFGSRHAKSPLTMLPYMDIRCLKHPSTGNFMKHPLIMSWLEKKLKANYLMMFMWFMIRISLILTYIMLDIDTSFTTDVLGNQTTHNTCPELSHVKLSFTEQMGLTTYIIVYGICVLVADIVFYISVRCRKSLPLRIMDLKGIKKPLTNNKFYFNSHEMLVLLLFVSGVC